jgi:hypothetical protein
MSNLKSYHEIHKEGKERVKNKPDVSQILVEYPTKRILCRYCKTYDKYLFPPDEHNSKEAVKCRMLFKEKHADCSIIVKPKKVKK